MDLKLYEIVKNVGKSLLTGNDVNIPQDGFTGAKIQSFVAIIFALIGGIALIMIILGGIKFITSEGNPEAVNKAKNTIIYAAIGLAISVAAFSIVTFATGRITG